MPTRVSDRFFSVKRTAARFQMSERHARRMARGLVEAGLARMTKRPGHKPAWYISENWRPEAVPSGAADMADADAPAVTINLALPGGVVVQVQGIKDSLVRIDLAGPAADVTIIPTARSGSAPR